MMQKSTTTNTRHREGETHHPMHCPTVNQAVTVTYWRNFASPNGDVRWWYCPLCRGWHVHLNEEPRYQ